MVLGPRLVSDRPDATARLTVFCAAGLKKPVEEAALAFERETGVTVALQYGGTGTLLSQMAIARTGDLFIAADEGALGDARRRDLVREVFPLVRQTPVIAVKDGNPLGIRTIDDLARPDVRTALANPEAASIGRVVKATLGERWHHLAGKAAVMKPTVTEIATDLSLGAVDAAIVWDAIVPQFPGLESIPVPEFEAKPENASACVLAVVRATASGAPAGSVSHRPGEGWRDFLEAWIQADQGGCLRGGTGTADLQRVGEPACPRTAAQTICRPRRRSDQHCLQWMRGALCVVENARTERRTLAA